MSARKRKPARKGNTSARPAAEHRRFGTPSLAAAYLQWVEARAGIDKINAGYVTGAESADHEAKVGALLDLEGEALWEIIRHPAETINDVRSRAEVLLHECRCVMEGGPPRDNHLQALAAAMCRDVDATPGLLQGIGQD